MSAIVDIFGNYSNYLYQMGGRGQREFLVHLINMHTSATQTILINPEGITKTGIRLQRHEFYHGVLSSITLGLRFSIDTGCGGSFIKSGFDTYGTRANIECHIYKHNSATNDFDIYYTGKIDYSPESYNYEPNERIVSANLIQTGLQQKLLSRDKQDLNLNSTTSIDGTTVTGLSQTNVEFKEIDIYQIGEAVGGTIYRSEFYGSSGTEDVYYNGGTAVTEDPNGRINFVDPDEGKIYENDTQENRDIKITSPVINYSVNTDCGSSDSINIEVFLEIRNASNALVDRISLYTFENYGEGSKSDSGTIADLQWGYENVPAGGYLRFYAVITRVYSSYCQLNFFNFVTSTNQIKATERSNSIGDSNVKCYHAISALQHLFRLATSNNNPLVYNDSILSFINSDYITSGYLLRNYPNKGCVTNIRNIFKTFDSIYPVCIFWDAANNRFELRNLEYAYQDSLGFNFGKVKSAKITPHGYFNKLIGGCNNTGNYEKEQGAFEFQLQTEHTTSFPFENSIDLRAPLRLDSIGMELLRRKRYLNYAVTDDRDDSAVFYVNAPFGITAQNTNLLEGFEGIEQYYNGKYLSRINLIECSRVFAGMFYKDTGEAVRFANNSKDINISYYDSTATVRVNLNDQILQARLKKPFTYPELHELEVELQDTDLQTVLNAWNKYFAWIDNNENIYYFYMESIEMNEFENTAKITGYTANINR